MAEPVGAGRRSVGTSRGRRVSPTAGGPSSVLGALVGGPDSISWCVLSVASVLEGVGGEGRVSSTGHLDVAGRAGVPTGYTAAIRVVTSEKQATPNSRGSIRQRESGSKQDSRQANSHFIGKGW